MRSSPSRVLPASEPASRTITSGEAYRNPVLQGTAVPNGRDGEAFERGPR